MSTMDPGMWDDDDALMEGLTEAVARERTVPEHVMQAAKDTFDWRGGARRAHGSGRACQIQAGHLAVC